MVKEYWLSKPLPSPSIWVFPSLTTPSRFKIPSNKAVWLVSSNQRPFHATRQPYVPPQHKKLVVKRGTILIQEYQIRCLRMQVSDFIYEVNQCLIERRCRIWQLSHALRRGQTLAHLRFHPQKNPTGLMRAPFGNILWLETS